MKEYRYNTPKDRTRAMPEFNDGERIVETAGYATSKQRIETILDAGQRLVEARKEQYHFENEKAVDDSFEDPTMRPNFDLADASILAKSTEAKLKKQAADNKAAYEKEVDRQEAEKKQKIIDDYEASKKKDE